VSESDQSIEIDGRSYYRIPENWIEVGVDDRRGDGPQTLAVSVAILRDSTLKIRYAHPIRTGVGAVFVPTREDVVLPDGDRDPWRRSIAASQLEPVDRIREIEQRWLEELWSDLVDDVLQDERALKLVDDLDDQDSQLVADGGSPNPHWTLRAEIAHRRLSRSDEHTFDSDDRDDQDDEFELIPDGSGSMPRGPSECPSCGYDHDGPDDEMRSGGGWTYDLDLIDDGGRIVQQQNLYCPVCGASVWSEEKSSFGRDRL